MGRNNSQWRREQRNEEALERQALYDKLSLQQKIEQLDKTFGVGKGATRQRARLTSLIESPPPSKKTKKGGKKKGRNK